MKEQKNLFLKKLVDKLMYRSISIIISNVNGLKISVKGLILSNFIKT